MLFNRQSFRRGHQLLLFTTDTRKNSKNLQTRSNSIEAIMSAQRFLFLVAVASLFVASLAVPAELSPAELSKRDGAPCKCGSTGGIYWFARYSCPSGYGYTSSCWHYAGRCCTPA